MGGRVEGVNTGDGYIEHVGLRVLRLCDPTEMRLMSKMSTSRHAREE